MTTINLGKIKPLYKGAYTGGVVYRPLDFTLYFGNLYICKAPSTGNLPTDPAYFDPVLSINAAAISNTPAGSIAATTVQAALNELDSEKVAKTDVIAIAKGGTGATTANAAADAIGAFRRGTLLGTVSQSAGVPTGAVIERGSNANGEYVRFADGTQIAAFVYAASTSMFVLGGFGMKHGALSRAWPATFVGTVYVSGAGYDSDANGRGWVVGNDSTTTQCITYYATASQGETLTVTAFVLAVGRWY